MGQQARRDRTSAILHPGAHLHLHLDNSDPTLGSSAGPCHCHCHCPRPASHSRLYCSSTHDQPESRRQVMELHHIQRLGEHSCVLGSSVALLPTRVPISLWRCCQRRSWTKQRRHFTSPGSQSSPSNGRKLDAGRQPASGADGSRGWQPAGDCSCPGPPSSPPLTQPPPTRYRCGWRTEQLGPIWGGRGPGRPPLRSTASL